MINKIKLTYLRDQKIEQLKYLTKIEEFSKNKNISMNKAITYFSKSALTSIEKEVISFCRKFFPYDGEYNERAEIQKLINKNNTIDNEIIQNTNGINSIDNILNISAESTEHIEHTKSTKKERNKKNQINNI